MRSRRGLSAPGPHCFSEVIFAVQRAVVSTRSMALAASFCGAVVPQHPGHCFHVYPILEGQSCESVPQIAEPDSRQPRPFQYSVEHVEHAVQGHEASCGTGEYSRTASHFFSADSKRLLYPLPEAGCDRAFFVSRGISTISPLILTTCRLIRRLFCSKSRSTYCRPRSSPAQAGDQLHIVEHEYSTFLSPRRKDANCSTGRVFYLFVLDREQYAAFSRVGEDRFCSLANSIAEAMI